MSRPIGWISDVTVERYASHVSIGYRDARRPGIGVLGIELDNGEHALLPEALQIVACERLGLPRIAAGSVRVIDY